MKKCIFILLAGLILLSGCSSNTIIEKTRLAADYNADWGTIATNLKIENQTVHAIKVAIIDTGANIINDRIAQGFNVINNAAEYDDKLNHGTILCKKLLDINKTVNIVPIKIFSDNAVLDVDNLCKGIKKAIEIGADVINISCGTDIYYQELEQVVDEAISKNIIVVAAAGNQGAEDLLYPARFENVISVMARDINNKDLSYNNKSQSKKSFSAPGDHILCDGEYYSGTSIVTIYITNFVCHLKQENIRIRQADILNWLITHSKYGNDYSYGFVIL